MSPTYLTSCRIEVGEPAVVRGQFYCFCLVKIIIFSAVRVNATYKSASCDILWNPTVIQILYQYIHYDKT